MQQIQLSHGGGGEEMNFLIKEVFFKYFKNELLESEDAAILQANGKIAFSSDSFTVSPLFFKGGDIGKLAVAGSVNDVSMMGAKPLYLSSSFIIEEGFSFEELEKILSSMADELKKSGAKIVCGDTKVVPKGSVDKIFINTAAIGEVIKEKISAKLVSTEDVIIVSNDIGRHGACIMAQREEIDLESNLESDCASLWVVVERLLRENLNIKALRDATRGGISAVLNEWAVASDICIEVLEESVPISDEVKGICEILGFEAYDFANEGTFILALPKEEASKAIEILKEFDICKNASIIADVSKRYKQKVILNTKWGSSRFLELPKGELLPRIC